MANTTRVKFTSNTKQFFKSFLPKKGRIEFYVEDAPHVYVEGKTGKPIVSEHSTVEIGKAHEFGLYGLPKRSFLEMPLRKKLPDIFRQINYFSKGYSSLDEMFQKIAQMGYNAIQEAFDTGGFGKWKKLSEAYKLATGRYDPALTDTGILRSSIKCNYNVNKTGVLGKISAQSLQVKNWKLKIVRD